ncbi:hypothetical protein BS47DRAFT_1333802 [Hydnum rufescens UP504]|uniref:Uncharacterized protein n=1 Tax=Hydnum rufescens UP504 TaxID=1448309 RepID=A0A9P6AJ36_9AGAM|nr:hypothetical protein BS47DRAFT_1333802 [Hydnum rufescens UP504]
MPQDNRGNDYAVKGSGTNTQGNRYDARDYGSGAPNQNSYHYSNKDGGYYYSNSDGSKYYNDGKGSSTYTPPGGTQDSGNSTGKS